MKSYLVLGLGRFGQAIAQALYEHGNEVLAVDENEDIVEEIQANVTHAVIGDCTDEAVLKSLGARNFDAAVVSVGGNIETSIMATVLLKELGVKNIIARAATKIHAKILTKVGADRVVLPEHDMGIRLAQSMSSANILDMIELSDNYSIVEVTPLKAWGSKSLSDIDLRSVYGVTVLAIKNKERVIILPDASYTLYPEDILIIIGRNKDIEKIKE